MRAFQPMGNTIVIAGNSVAPSGKQALGFGSNQPTWYRIFNPDGVTAWYALGTSGGAAQTNAVIPLNATPSAGIGLPPLAVEVITAPPGVYFSAITASGNANVQVTPGEGL